MGRAKEIDVRVIPERIATPFVKAHHYSGKVVQNSQLHFGCFLDGGLHGVMSFGPSMDKRRMLTLVQTDNKTEREKWNEFIELNRMAFDDYLPPNSESRCLGVAFRLLKRNAPHIKYVISFSDATASGDGTIYRASGFLLTQIAPNKSILVLPDGERIAQINFTNGFSTKKRICAKLGIPVWGGGKFNSTAQGGGKICRRLSAAIYQVADAGLPASCSGYSFCRYRQGRRRNVERQACLARGPAQKKTAWRGCLMSEKVGPTAISELDARRTTLCDSRIKNELRRILFSVPFTSDPYRSVLVEQASLGFLVAKISFCF